MTRPSPRRPHGCRALSPVCLAFPGSLRLGEHTCVLLCVDSGVSEVQCVVCVWGSRVCVSVHRICDMHGVRASGVVCMECVCNMCMYGEYISECVISMCLHVCGMWCVYTCSMSGMYVNDDCNVYTAAYVECVCVCAVWAIL